MVGFREPWVGVTFGVFFGLILAATLALLPFWSGCASPCPWINDWLGGGCITMCGYSVGTCLVNFGTAGAATIPAGGGLGWVAVRFLL